MHVNRQGTFAALATFTLLSLSAWNVNCGEFPVAINNDVYLGSGLWDSNTWLFSNGTTEYCATRTDKCRVYEKDSTAVSGYVFSTHEGCQVGYEENESKEGSFILSCIGCEGTGVTRELVRVDSGIQLNGDETELRDKNDSTRFVRDLAYEACLQYFNILPVAQDADD